MNFKELLIANMGQWEYLIRIVVSCICGAVIGLERSRRLKEAGLRTHIILALASALIMLVSKYGFFDYIDHVDYSRIAANIVNGISFLCAGVIFVRGSSIKGLTTATGLWATAGVGMAIGSGMYVIGLSCTVFIVIIQIILHRFVSTSDSFDGAEIRAVIDTGNGSFDDFRAFLDEQKIIIDKIDLKKDGCCISLRLTARVPINLETEKLISEAVNLKYINEFSLD